MCIHRDSFMLIKKLETTKISISKRLDKQYNGMIITNKSQWMTYVQKHTDDFQSIHASKKK